VAEQAAIAAADAVTITAEIGAAAADIGSAMAEAALPVAKAEPAPAAPLDAAAETSAEAEFEKTVETAIADDVPPAKAKPLVEALNEAAPKPASVEHPIVSTVPLEAAAELELPAVTPVEHTPAPALVQASKPARASRKK
jgi:hypothetical protein